MPYKLHINRLPVPLFIIAITIALIFSNQGCSASGGSRKSTHGVDSLKSEFSGTKEKATGVESAAEGMSELTEDPLAFALFLLEKEQGMNPHYNKIGDFVDIAVAYAKSGNKAEAADTLHDALKFFNANKESMSSKDIIVSLCRIADGYSTIGLSDMSVKVLDNIKESYSLMDGSRYLTSSYAKAAPPAAVLEAAKSIGRKDLQALALLDAAEVYLEMGDKSSVLSLLDQTLKIAPLVKDDGDRASILIKAALLYVEADKKDDAAEVLSMAMKEMGKQMKSCSQAYNLAGASEIRIMLGDKEQALASMSKSFKLIEKEKDKECKIKVLGMLAYLYASVGDQDRSQKIIQQIGGGLGSPHEVMEILIGISTEFARNGEKKKALDALSEMEKVVGGGCSAFHHDLASMAAIYQEMGMKDKAILAALRIHSENLYELDTLPALLEMNKIYYEVGMKKAAANNLVRILEATEAEDSDHSLIKALIAVGALIRENKVKIDDSMKKILVAIAKKKHGLEEKGVPPDHESKVKDHDLDANAPSQKICKDSKTSTLQARELLSCPPKPWTTTVDVRAIQFKKDGPIWKIRKHECEVDPKICDGGLNDWGECTCVMLEMASGDKSLWLPITSFESMWDDHYQVVPFGTDDEALLVTASFAGLGTYWWDVAWIIAEMGGKPRVVWAGGLGEGVESEDFDEEGSAETYTNEPEPVDISIVDYNNDGHLDIVLGYYHEDSEMCKAEVYEGDGKSFKQPAAIHEAGFWNVGYFADIVVK